MRLPLPVQRLGAVVGGAGAVGGAAAIAGVGGAVLVLHKVQQVRHVMSDEPSSYSTGCVQAFWRCTTSASRPLDFLCSVQRRQKRLSDMDEALKNANAQVDTLQSAKVSTLFSLSRLLVNFSS